MFFKGSGGCGWRVCVGSCFFLRSNGRSQGVKTHAKARENGPKGGFRPLTDYVATYTLMMMRSQQRLEFVLLPAAMHGPNAVRRDSRLVPSGEGDLHRRRRFLRVQAAVWEPDQQEWPPCLWEG